MVVPATTTPPAASLLSVLGETIAAARAAGSGDNVSPPGTAPPPGAPPPGPEGSGFTVAGSSGPQGWPGLSTMNSPLASAHSRSPSCSVARTYTLRPSRRSAQVRNDSSLLSGVMER